MIARKLAISYQGRPMYTKEERSRQRQAFWTRFGQYMSPILSAEGTPVNWVNYKTGIKDIYFKMDVDDKTAQISIVVAHADINMQLRVYAQLLQLRDVLDQTLGEQWEWHEANTDNYARTISSVSKCLESVNINRTEDWPAIISFLKPRIIALDEFWSLAKYSFENIY